MTHDRATIARTLKGICVDYIIKHLQEEFFASSSAKRFFERYDNESASLGGDFDETGGEWIQALDWFLLFGTLSDGRRVIDVIPHRVRLSKYERATLEEWRDHAFESVFEIKKVAEDHCELFDLVAETLYKAYGNDPQCFHDVTDNMREGYFLLTNLLPVDGVWFFSGRQGILPPSSRVEQEIFERLIKPMPVPAIYRNNPQKLARAFALQKEEYHMDITFQNGTKEIGGIYINIISWCIF